MIIHNIKLEYKNVNDNGIQDFPIFFYTHQTAETLPAVLKAAILKTKGNWNNEAGVAGEIFRAIANTDTLDVMGYGIAPYDMELDGKTITINLERQTVDNIPFAAFITA